MTENKQETINDLSCEANENKAQPNQVTALADAQQSQYASNIKSQLTEDILLQIKPYQTKVAVVQQGMVQELWIERYQHSRQVNNIYWAKVERLMPGMQAAFLQIDDKESAFLHASDISRYLNPQQLPIQKVLFEGQYLLVQITKDSINGKHARASTHITLAGRNLVYLPFEGKVGVSNRIKNQEQRQELFEKLQKINQTSGGEGGYILRTIAIDASLDDLLLDANYLQHTWQLIKQNISQQIKPCIVYQDLDLSFKVCRDLVRRNTKTIWVDNAETYEQLREFTQKYIPSAYQALKLYPEGQDLFELYQIEKDIEIALKRKVELKSGASIIFDTTQALTTIDVNTGSFMGRKNFEDTILQTNLESVKAIARQLRLRNIGGMILIDFIDMKEEESRQQVLQALIKHLSFDHAKHTVYGFTQLGLVEMTRKRTHESLQQILGETCSHCQGQGWLHTTQTTCYKILEAIEHQSQQFKPNSFKIIAHDEVINAFLTHEKHHLKALSDQIGISIQLQSQYFTDESMYQIVLQ